MTEPKANYHTSPRTYTEDYFRNRQEQGRIKEALWKAFPTNVYYCNAIIALSEMLQRLVEGAYSDDVMSKPPLDPVESGKRGGVVWDGDEAEGDN